MFQSMKWKMIVPILMAVVLVISSFALYIHDVTERSIHQQGEALVESVRLGLEGATLSREVAEEIMENEMIAQSVLISWTLENGVTHEDLKQLAARGNIDEIWSTDALGNTMLTSIAPKIDFNFGSDPEGQASEYMTLLANPNTAVTQPAQVRDIDGEFYKFVGTGSWNPASPKIIQVARNGQKLLDLEAQIGKEFYMEQLQQHLNETVLYAAVVSKAGDVLASTSDEERTYNADQLMVSETTSEKGKLNGERVMNYFMPLSDGNTLAITLSNDVLTMITKATIIASIIAVALVVFIADRVISWQIRRITRVRDSLTEISSGDADLTKRIAIRANDEIGQLVTASNAVMDNFQDIMIELKERAQTVHETSKHIQRLSVATTDASHDIEQQSKGVANDSHVQLNNIEDSSLAMEELARNIQGVTESIRDISQQTNTMEDRALTGSTVMNDLIQTLQHLHEESRASVERTNELVQLSSKIGEFTSIISGISNQTNLLALNASIEAARSGEAGKGFAVVADEVRKLAEESKVAAERIAHVVFDVQHETGQIVEAISSTATVLDEGLSVANKAHASFDGIVGDIQYIADEVEIVSKTTQDMSVSTQEIATAFEDVSLLSKQTTARVENVAKYVTEQVDSMKTMNAEVETLFDVSSELQDITGHYKLK
ncbi:MAG: methyl-accepting chemotaxis protein [Caryophanon sp.]|nr:methyl-accepting chemotaxis protein [Caryophanon sp.]